MNNNIHILPTEKDSELYLGNLGKPVTIQSASAQFKKLLHIYITSDEEIKEGDWYLSFLVSQPIPTKNNGKNSKGFYNHEKTKKIILTTDQDLIKDGVQAIDDEFLEWFVKNPSCEWVEISTFEVEDYVGFAGHTSYSTFHNEYKIIIPQEEPKQETLEEASKNYSLYNEQVNKAIQEAVKFGAKWQAERIPSIIEQYLETAFISKEQGYMNPQKWFEQFKNKGGDK